MEQGHNARSKCAANLPTRPRALSSRCPRVDANCSSLIQSSGFQCRLRKVSGSSLFTMVETFSSMSDSEISDRITQIQWDSAYATPPRLDRCESIWGTTSIRCLESNQRKSLSPWGRHFERFTATAILRSRVAKAPGEAGSDATSREMEKNREPDCHGL